MWSKVPNLILRNLNFEVSKNSRFSRSCFVLLAHSVEQRFLTSGSQSSFKSVTRNSFPVSLFKQALLKKLAVSSTFHYINQVSQLQYVVCVDR